MADMSAPSGQAPAAAPPVRPLLLPPPYRQYTSNSSGIQFNMTRKLETIGVSWMNNDIQEASYYQEYQENVAKHRGFLADETGSTQDLPTPKPAKPAKKPKSTAQKAPPKPSISTRVASTQPAPTSAPAKSQENKRKQATEIIDKPAKAKRIKHSISRKTRQPRSSLKSVGASKAEEVPAVEPRVADEEADYKKAVEESLKTAHAVHRGPLPPVVIREPESGKYQPPPKVPGKGKSKVTEKQVAHDLLILQKAKRKNPMEQYIFQRRIFEPTGSSFHDESPYDVLGQSDSEEESKKVLTGASEGGNDDVQTGPDPDVKMRARRKQTLIHLMKARLDQTLMKDLKARLDQTLQLDEGFLATAYPKIQESLKLAVKEHVLLEEPASSSGTFSSLHHLSKDISFEDQFFSDKPLDVDKNAETKVELMVNVLIQQATSLISISPMTSPIIDLSLRPVSPKVHQQFKATKTDTTTTTTTNVPPPQAQQQSTTEAMMVKHIGELEHILADLIQVNKNMEERLDKHGARLYTLEQLDIPQQVSIAVSEVVMDAVDWAMQAPLRNRFRDLPDADMKEILHQRMWETESYKTYEDHSLLFEALENSMNLDHSEELAQDLVEAHKKKRKHRESPKTPPGSPPHQPPPPPPPTGPSGPSKAPGASGSQVTPPPLPPPPPPLSTSQDSPPKGSAAPSPSKTAASTKHQAWTTPDVTLRTFISLTPADLDMDEAMGPDEQAQLSNDEDIGSAHISTVNLRQDWWKPLEEERIATSELAWSIPSSDAPTGDMATFIDWFCKRRGITELKSENLEGPAFEIIKEHRQQTPTTGWSTGSSHHPIRLLLQQRFRISEIRKQGWYRINFGSMRSENMILLQCMASLTGGSEDNDSTLIDTRLKDKYGVQMMMRLNEIHKFSDGILQQIDEALDYRVKEFRINRMNPGIPTVAAAGQKDVNSQLHAHSSNSLSMIAKRPTTQLPRL
nr:hypothetical protein [Tanacetum cinerariifolium]